MSGGLQRHLRRTYGAMIATVLVSVVFFIGLVACLAQLNKLESQTRAALDVYAARARPLGPIVSQAQVARIVAGTSHPGWVFSVAVDNFRYVVQWAPMRISTQARGALLDPRTPPPLQDRITELAFLLGTRLPAHFILNRADLVLSPDSSVQWIITRTFAITFIISVLVTLLALRLADRMALDTLRPIRALHEALGHMAESALDPQAVHEAAAGELGDLVRAYNRAIEAGNKAREERDAAKARTHQFIADAGHQLRTPLTVLSGFVGILRSGRLRHPDDGPKILEKMESQIGIMKKLVERLMLLENWHSAENVEQELSDIGEFITSVVEPMAASHPEMDIRINAVDGAKALIDPSEMTYAVTNIVANAIKYAPDGCISVDVVADDKNVCVSISDEGPGIDAETLPLVFDRFYRGRRRDVPGSGLGLAIAKVAVERANGTIDVQSEPGKGTRFTITLPRACAIAPESALTAVT